MLNAGTETPCVRVSSAEFTLLPPQESLQPKERAEGGAPQGLP